ncbi:MAG: hypothetical protein M3N95_04870 [Actinomycetota bacterium]|nr:hypothetical protein [Actinomycetota bacterium]
MSNQAGPRAPGARRVLAGGEWPPPVTTDDVYEDVRVWIPGTARQTVVSGRVARLWGQRVVLDESGAAFCDGCRAFVPLAELVAADNDHRVGLPPIRGALLPYEPEPPSQTPRTAWF